jgi:hypothetical protein
LLGRSRFYANADVKVPRPEIQERAQIAIAAQVSDSGGFEP